MQMNRYFLLFVFLFTSYPSYTLNVSDVLRNDPSLQVNPAGYLDLSNKDIDSLDGLANFPNIETITELNLSGNLLTKLDDGAFVMMPLLRRLFLRSNPLKIVGNNLFAPDICVSVFLNNDLPEDQRLKLTNQLTPESRQLAQNSGGQTLPEPETLRSDWKDRLVQAATTIANRTGWKLEKRFNKWLPHEELPDSEAVACAVGIGGYIALKVLFAHQRLAKANLVLDAVVHGANVASFLLRLCKRPSSLRVDDGLILLENGVHLHNIFKDPASVHGIIQSRTGFNLNSITCNPIVWSASLLPWARAFRYGGSIQDAMMAPWALCPSRFSKFVEGARGAMASACASLPMLCRLKNFVTGRANNNTSRVHVRPVTVHKKF